MDGIQSWHTFEKCRSDGTHFHFISFSLYSRQGTLCRGFPKKRNTTTKALQETVEKASHRLWVKREDTSWSESRRLTAKGPQLN